jgi:hypothetical protein
MWLGMPAKGHQRIGGAKCLGLLKEVHGAGNISHRVKEQRGEGLAVTRAPHGEAGSGEIA